MLKKIIAFLINIINFISPKIKKKTIYCSFPDFDDNFHYIHSAGLLDGIIVLTSSHYINAEKGYYKCKLVDKYSFLGIYHLVTSSKVIYTHGLFDGFRLVSKNRQLVINIWHGMPLKKIGLLDSNSIVPKFHYTLATSDFFRPIIMKVFGVAEHQVVLNNLPRNMFLLRPEFSRRENLFPNINLLYIWMPTYRHSVIGCERVDSNEELISECELHHINQGLIQSNSILLIKMHPMQKALTLLSNRYSNIKVIDEAWLVENKIKLYELLAITDSLITDYSSVFVDYLLTRKPIIFTTKDSYKYQDARGFTYDLDKYPLPGTCVNSLIDVFSLSLSECFIPEHLELYHSISLFNLEKFDG